MLPDGVSFIIAMTLGDGELSGMGAFVRSSILASLWFPDAYEAVVSTWLSGIRDGYILDGRGRVP